MSEYTFRGKSISGFAAYALLGSIKLVEEKAPNPTPEDIKVLEEICAAFSVEYIESLRQSRDEEDLENE